MFVLISINFEGLFTSTFCMDCKALSISKNSCISKSVFCDNSRVYLTWKSSAKNESSMNGILSISTVAGGLSYKFKILLIKFSLPKVHLNEFGIKNLPVRYFSLWFPVSTIKKIHKCCLFLNFFRFYINLCQSDLDHLLHSSVCTMKLFNHNGKVDVACLSIEPGIVKVVSATLLSIWCIVTIIIIIIVMILSSWWVTSGLLSSSSTNIGLSIYLVCFCPLDFLDFVEKFKNKIYETMYQNVMYTVYIYNRYECGFGVS